MLASPNSAPEPAPPCPLECRQIALGPRSPPRQVLAVVAAGALGPGAGVSARDPRAESRCRGKSPRVSEPEKRAPALAGVAAGGGIYSARPVGARGAGVASGDPGTPGRRHHADLRARGDPRPTGSLLRGALRPGGAGAPPPESAAAATSAAT